MELRARSDLLEARQASASVPIRRKRLIYVVSANTYQAWEKATVPLKGMVSGDLKTRRRVGTVLGIVFGYLSGMCTKQIRRNKRTRS